MSHLIDPCLRATKIAHGIRRGIDGLSPLSGLVPELRILIQEQKNVLTSLKRTAFEKEEAAKHLAIYAKTEGPDIADTLTKLAILIEKVADVQRVYASHLGHSRELFKDIRVAEDENYSMRKRKIDLEQKLASERLHHPYSHLETHSASHSSSSLASSNSELSQEMKLLRKETIVQGNDLEDMKRAKIKKATAQHLDALERMGKELLVIAHYGRDIMTLLDDTPTPAGTFADERFSTYEGEAKTAFAVKACLETLRSWPDHAPNVTMLDIDLGDFPRDNKQAADAFLKSIAEKTGSDWYDLQTNPKRNHNRSDSISSLGSGRSESPSAKRNSLTSSTLTTMTYVDGLPIVSVINEIPPTPESENGPVMPISETESIPPASPKPQPAAAADTTVEDHSATEDASTTTAAGTATPGRPSIGSPVLPSSPGMKDSSSPRITPTSSPRLVATSAQPLDGAVVPPRSTSPFIPHSTYMPATKYQPGTSHPIQGVDGHGQGRTPSPSPPVKARPTSGEQPPVYHPPHPLMVNLMTSSQQQQQQQQHQPGYQPLVYPPGQTQIPMPMPMPMPMVPRPMSATMQMPMPTAMPVPYVPGAHGDYDEKRHSGPISVSFPMYPPQRSHHPRDFGSLGTSPTSSSVAGLGVAVGMGSPSPVEGNSNSTPSARPPQAVVRPGPRNPQAIVSPTTMSAAAVAAAADLWEGHGAEVEQNDEDSSIKVEATDSASYDGPPPDYAEASMLPPAEKLDEKRDEKRRH